MSRRYKKIDPRKKSIVRALLFLNFVVWLVYTIYIYFDMAVVNHNELAADIATIYVFVNSLLMFLSAYLLGNRQKPAFYFALIVVIVNILLTVLNLTDAVFLIAFVLDVIILWLLVPLRHDYS